MFISSSIFLFWDSTREALYDLQLKRFLIYLMLACYTTPQFIFCHKTLGMLTSAHSPDVDTLMMKFMSWRHAESIILAEFNVENGDVGH